MSQKLEFIDRVCVPGANISALCSEFGSSRQTGHKWLRRYRERGYEGLADESRRPRSSPLTTGEEIVVAIVEWRERRPSWGPDRIPRVLARRFGENGPSRSAVAAPSLAFSAPAAPAGRLADQVRANSEPAPHEGRDSQWIALAPAPTVVEPKTAELSRVHLTVPRRLLEKLAAAGR